MPEIRSRLAAEPDAPHGRDALDVLVLGELNADVLVHGVGSFVRFGQVETQVSGAALQLGSSGAITAAAACAMGLRTALCAVVGDDHAGRVSTELLAGTGVESAVQVRAGVSTGLTVVLNADDGDRALLTHVGAMAALRVDDVPADLLARAAHVHISSIFLQRGLQAGLPGLLAGLRDRGVTTSLDPGWDPDESWSAVAPLLPHLDYLLPNEAELSAIAGTGIDLVTAARALAALGPTVVVKHGARGAMYASTTAGWALEGRPVTPLDTTGAGDNFDAGLLWALSRGHTEPADLLAAATTAGAVSVAGLGGTGAIATAEQLVEAVATLAGAARRLW